MKKLSKKSTYVALAISALAIIATVVFLIIYDKKKNAASGAASGSGSNSGSGSGSGSNSGSSATTPTASVFPLKKGSRGDEVRKLQAKMNEWTSYYWFTLTTKPPYQRLSEDGVFGAKTEANLNFILKKKSITESAYRNFIAMSFGPVDAGGDFWTGSQYSFLKYM